jgi:hypothetical protein
VSVTLNLKPEIEAGLQAQARAAGVPFDEFLSRSLENLSQVNIGSDGRPRVLAETRDINNGQWEKELDAWFDSFPQRSLLSDDALNRENWYPDRW